MKGAGTPALVSMIYICSIEMILVIVMRRDCKTVYHDARFAPTPRMGSDDSTPFSSVPESDDYDRSRKM